MILALERFTKKTAECETAWWAGVLFCKFKGCLQISLLGVIKSRLLLFEIEILLLVKNNEYEAHIVLY